MHFVAATVSLDILPVFSISYYQEENQQEKFHNQRHSVAACLSFELP